MATKTTVTPSFDSIGRMAATVATKRASTRRLRHQTPRDDMSAVLNHSSTDEDPFSVDEPLPGSSSADPLVTIIYVNAVSSSENQQILLNSYATCQRLLDHLKHVAGIHSDERIDVMDNEGKLIELSEHADDYASQFLTARSTYYILKVEADLKTGNKRYTLHFNPEKVDQKLSNVLTSALQNLNKSVKVPKRGPTTRQNSIVQSSANAPTARSKRTANQK